MRELAYAVLLLAVSTIQLCKGDDVMLNLLSELEEAKLIHEQWINKAKSSRIRQYNQAEEEVNTIVEDTYALVETDTDKYDKVTGDVIYHNVGCLQQTYKRLSTFRDRATGAFHVCSQKNAQQFQAKTSRQDIVEIQRAIFVAKSYLRTCSKKSSQGKIKEKTSELATECSTKAINDWKASFEPLITSSLVVKGKSAETALETYTRQSAPCYLSEVEYVRNNVDNVKKQHKKCLEN